MTVLLYLILYLLYGAGDMARNKTRPLCKLYSIPCNDGIGCYSISDMCDGVPRCKDATDEKRCSLQTSEPTATGSQPTQITCPSGVTCVDVNKNKICLRESDICDGIQQCREGFDESSCPSHRNPYIIPTIISLTAVLIIIIIMCVVYKLCIYRYSTRHHAHVPSTCSAIFFKKSHSDTHLELPQIELPEHCENGAAGTDRVYVPVIETREQFVQYPSDTNGYSGYSDSDNDNMQCVSTI